MVASAAESFVLQPGRGRPVGQGGVGQELLDAPLQDSVGHRVEGDPPSADSKFHELVGVSASLPEAAGVVLGFQRDVPSRDTLAFRHLPQDRAIPEAPGEAAPKDFLRNERVLTFRRIEFPIHELHQIAGAISVGEILPPVLPGRDIKHRVVGSGVGGHAEPPHRVHLLHPHPGEPRVPQTRFEIGSIGLPKVIGDGVPGISGVRRKRCRQQPPAAEDPVNLSQESAGIRGMLEDVVGIDGVEGPSREREMVEVRPGHNGGVGRAGLSKEGFAIVDS